MPLDEDEDDLDAVATDVARTVGGVVLRPMSRADVAAQLDPSIAGWPPLLPMELALHLDTPKNICAGYQISKDRWEIIRTNPQFIAEVNRAVEALRKEGMSFKARSQIQANELLKLSWKLMHDPSTPPNVAADLIKSTVRWSGLDASKDPALAGKAGGATFAIQINLG